MIEDLVKHVNEACPQYKHNELMIMHRDESGKVTHVTTLFCLNGDTSIKNIVSHLLENSKALKDLAEDMINKTLNKN